MTPVERTLAEFERLAKLLATFSRPDHRTDAVFDQCAEVLSLSSVELKPYLTDIQIAQLDHAYWHFMDCTVEVQAFGDVGEDGKLNGSYLEDICQSTMAAVHEMILHPDKYPAKDEGIRRQQAG